MGGVTHGKRSGGMGGATIRDGDVSKAVNQRQ